MLKGILDQLINLTIFPILHSHHLQGMNQVFLIGKLTAMAKLVLFFTTIIKKQVVNYQRQAMINAEESLTDQVLRQLMFHHLQIIDNKCL